jgi:hypothetical protein
MSLKFKIRKHISILNHKPTSNRSKKLIEKKEVASLLKKKQRERKRHETKMEVRKL